MTESRKPTDADIAIGKCLQERRSFFVIAGAGSGKTTSLVDALAEVRHSRGKELRRDSQRVACITFTKRAVAVISARLGWDELFLVSTLHSFLWGEVKRFPLDIRRMLVNTILPARLEAKRAEDNGGNSQRALAAREKVLELERSIELASKRSSFSYGDSTFSDYETGELGHDDVLEVASQLIMASAQLRLVVGQRYPYVFVDEAQDTHEQVVQALNTLCKDVGLPLIGYFGDPMQQIYDKRAGNFQGPGNSVRIAKEDNFRCSPEVVKLLNAFRKDIQQHAAGKNAEIAGSVILRLVQAETPTEPRNRYSQEQLERSSQKLDQALLDWDWAGRRDVKHLYLVRQMIARRLGFVNIHRLFTGEYASTRAQEGYENGEHHLLRPFVECLCPLMKAHADKDYRMVLNILRKFSPAFDPSGKNAKRPISEMSKGANQLVEQLAKMWQTASVRELLQFSEKEQLCRLSVRLLEHLKREPRSEQYDDELHSKDKGDWLADSLFEMKISEIERFAEFISEQTPFSTQHGVKGEEYPRVLVVFDDLGSAWSNYNFAKTLTPIAAGGQPTERQKRLSENLAYVCFSRAEKDLRIVLYSQNPEVAKKELVDRQLLAAEQIEIA